MSNYTKMANAVRALAMDAVEQAKSGHPGMPMGFADVATILYADFLKFDPEEPDWPDRDRFVLSAGHGSMLLYALLHLTGYPGWTIDTLRNFRQLGSPAAGHPEFGHGAGIETTTGPLGQGVATAVGMAMAEEMDRARFGSDLVDHRTWVVVGDGCLMEGISQEAITLAGHLVLSKLTVLFDDNNITIDGGTALATSDDQKARFRAAGWDVLEADGHDPKAIKEALAASLTTERPTMIAFQTQIGFGAGDKAGTSKCHGAPLGETYINEARKNLNWSYAPFELPESVRADWVETAKSGRLQRKAWSVRLASSPESVSNGFEEHVSGQLPDYGVALSTAADDFLAKGKPLATRAASGMVLEQLTAAVPALIGGSADLTGSVNTFVSGMETITAKNFHGRYIHYGVREHGMAAFTNGMALHGGYIPYAGTFLVFAGYMLGAMRLSALMRQKVIYVLTHDSIGLGEDGPTHQPVETLAQLRALPGLTVLRPGDPVEVAEAWGAALEVEGPVALVLSRQGVPVLRDTGLMPTGARQGGYVLLEAEGGVRDVTLIGTGTELSLAVEAREILASEGIRAAVISLPSFELFEALDDVSRAAILGSDDVPRVAVEAATRFGWDQFIGRDGKFVGMTGYGASGPAGELYNIFGITADAVAESARELVNAKRKASK